MELLPAPTPEQLRALRTEMGWSARQAGEAFWYPDAGPSWRRVEARGMEPLRWTLGLLALGRHPTQRLGPRE